MLPNLIAEFRRQQQMAEEALGQLDDLSFFKRPAPQVNAVATIVKHLGGNLRSRWTNFLTSDGEKPDRNRDGESILADDDSRPRLMDGWRQGWERLFMALEALSPDDLSRTITIRGEPHRVPQAIVRSLSHTAYHVGQILYLVRLLCPESKWLTIAPEQSGAHSANFLPPTGANDQRK